MDAPQLNLTSPALLLGLCYRALAADANPAEAALTLRKLEHSQVNATAQLAQRSTSRANTGILEQQEHEARAEAQRLALDLRIFNDAQPPAPRQRGMFTRRLAPAEQALEARRCELIVLAEQAAQRAGGLQQQLAQERATLAGAGMDKQELEQVKAGLLALLAQQSAAQVLGLLAAGQAVAAREVLDEQRSSVRGELITGVLYVLLAWFTSGPGAAHQALLDFHGIFSQHPDPAARVLEALLLAGGGEPVAAQELGLFTREQFSLPGLHRLYQLARVLAGRTPDGAALDGDPFYPTLWVLDQQQRLRHGADTPGLATPDALAQWAAGGGLFVRLAACSLLLRRDEGALIPQAAGLDIAAIPAPRRAPETWPPLLALLPAAEAAWPAAYAPALAAALACHVLCRAQRAAPAALYETWLAESYGWPKTDLYWWALALCQADLALLNNIQGGPGELFAVAPL
jgi:hypothetical protein